MSTESVNQVTENARLTNEKVRERVEASLRKRYRQERRFQMFGLAAVIAAVSFIGILFYTIVAGGVSAFWQSQIRLDIEFSQSVIDPDKTGDPAVYAQANYQKLVRNALLEFFPEADNRSGRRALNGLVSSGAAFELQAMVRDDPSLIGTTQTLWLLTRDQVDLYLKQKLDRETLLESGRIKEQQLAWVDQLVEEGIIEMQFNSTFFTAGDSRNPEMAGIWGAMKGSFFMLLVTLSLSFPLGVAAAVYLEEFAPKNKWVDLIEVNINNLAAVPSIVFGLLGLAVFLKFFGLPRSAPLVGGLVLTLMTLPTVIIAGRSALKSVPPSIREAALGLGASRMQAVVHHVLPLAMPGMLTGVILGMAQALGETAPLLMIGMVAFIVEPPAGPLDPATALPVQIYLWADSPERAFAERTAAAIMVLMAFLFVMNIAAVWLRRRFEQRW